MSLTHRSRYGACPWHAEPVSETAEGVLPHRDLPVPTAGISRRRRVGGLALAAVLLLLLTGVLLAGSSDLTLGSILLLYLTAVVAAAAVGGMLPGVLTAVVSVLVANWFFTPPFHTLLVANGDAVVELVVFAAVALMVSLTVEVAARDRAQAVRNRIEADLLSQVAARPAGELSLTEVLEQVCATFGMTSAALVRRGPGGEEVVVASVGPLDDDDSALRVPASATLELVAGGPRLFAEDRGVVERLAAAAARAWETQHLVAEAGHLAEVDRVRSALLAAVGHDLRTPLAGLKAAVSSLRQDDVEWSLEEQAELLSTIEESSDRLNDLIANILDMTRIQVGAVVVHAEPVAVDEVAALALLDVAATHVRLEIPDSLPLVLTDAGLLERVVANLVDNAVKHSPPGRPAAIRARAVAGGVELSVVDHGPGVSATLWPAMVAPFQRLGDRDAVAGMGLGLAIVQGFCSAMDLEVVPSPTAGGGLTATVRLPVARP